MDAEKSSKLVKAGINTVDAITDWAVLKPSTQSIWAKAEGKRVVDKMNTFL